MNRHFVLYFVLLVTLSCDTFIKEPSSFTTLEARSIINSLDENDHKSSIPYLDSLLFINSELSPANQDFLLALKHNVQLRILKNKKDTLGIELQAIEANNFYTLLLSSTQFKNYSSEIRFFIIWEYSRNWTLLGIHHKALDEKINACHQLEESNHAYDFTYEIAKAYLNIGTYANFNFNEKEKHETTILKALDILKNTSHYNELERIYMYLSHFEWDKKNYKQAIIYCKQWINICDTIGSHKDNTKYTSSYPLLIQSFEKLGEKDSVVFYLNQVEKKFKANNIDPNIYEMFSLETLPLLLTINKTELFLERSSSLRNKIPEDCENRYKNMLLYQSKCLFYQNKNLLKEERELLLKTIELAKCKTQYNYQKDKIQESYNRLIWIDSMHKNYQEVLKWTNIKLMHQMELEKEEMNAFISQVHFLSNSNIIQIEHKRRILKKKNNFGSILLIIIILFLTFVLGFVMLLRKLNKKLLLQKKITVDKNNLLNISNKELLVKQAELAGELKANIVTQANYLELFGHLRDKISTSNGLESSAKNDLLKIIRIENNADLINELDFKYMQLHKVFFEKLSKKYTNLTSNNLKLCSYLKMNLSTKEIAALNHTSIGSVKVARNRLRKKLGLEDSKTSLSAFLNSI